MVTVTVDGNEQHLYLLLKRYLTAFVSFLPRNKIWIDFQNAMWREGLFWKQLLRMVDVQFFNACCLLIGHTYLNKLAAFIWRLACQWAPGVKVLTLCVNSFALQINWLVSIWWQLWHLMCKYFTIYFHVVSFQTTYLSDVFFRFETARI